MSIGDFQVIKGKPFTTPTRSPLSLSVERAINSRLQQQPQVRINTPRVSPFGRLVEQALREPPKINPPQPRTPPTLPPPNTPPNAGFKLSGGGVGVGAAIGLGLSLIFPEPTGDPPFSRRNNGTTPPASTPNSYGTPPFTGGQGGVMYNVRVLTETPLGNTQYPNWEAAGYGQSIQNFQLKGPIGGIGGVGTTQVRIVFDGGRQTGVLYENQIYNRSTIVEVTRVDGNPDNDGDPPRIGSDSNGIGNSISSPSPYGITAPPPTASPTGIGGKLGIGAGIAAGIGAGIGIGSSSSSISSSSTSSSSTSTTPNSGGQTIGAGSTTIVSTVDVGGIAPTLIPFNAIAPTLIAPTQIPFNAIQPIAYPPTVTPAPVNPTQIPPQTFTPPQNPPTVTPTTPPASEQTLQEVLAKLGLIPAAVVGAITLDQLFNAKQKQNAKEAVCEEFQPDACGFNAVKQNTDNVGDKVDAGNVAADTKLNGILGALAGISTFLNTMFEWIKAAFNNTVVDKAINLLNLITNLHNAAMLSTSIKDTLAEAISLGLATVGIKSPEGSPIDINGAINSSIENLLKGVLGVEQYTALKESWAKANRIIQSGAAVINTARSLYDSTRSLNELTGNNVGRIGNALKRDGVVSENAYKVMSENTSQVNTRMEQLQNLENVVSTLSSITSETYSITENVAEITKQRADFEKNIKDLEPKTQVENVPLKTKETAEKTVSISPEIPLTELYKPDI